MSGHHPHPPAACAFFRLAHPWRTSLQLAGLPEIASGSFSFAVLGDVEPCRFRIGRLLFNRPRVFAHQLRCIQAQPVTFCVQLGDMVSRGSEHYYRRFLEDLHDLEVKKPYLTVIGNHDRSRPNGPSHARMYRRIFGRSNYRFDYGGVRFITVDTSARGLRPSQLRWLSRALDTDLRKVVFTHMPPVQLNLWGGSFAHAHGGFSRGAREFTEMMAAAGVARVYAGHVHAFGVQDYLGVRYVLTGGGGSALFPSGAADRFHHYLTVSVTPHGLRESVHPLDGRPFHIPEAKVILPHVPTHWLARVLGSILVWWLG
ncbi:MAG: metallophosphoesterase [Elusimicrobiota bacterium]